MLDEAANKRIERLAKAAAKDLGNKKILIIAEDTADTLDGLRMQVELMLSDKCRVIPTHNGEEAMIALGALHQALRPEDMQKVVLFTDDYMPKLTGLQLINMIRNGTPDIKDINIILFTGDPDYNPQLGQMAKIVEKPIAGLRLKQELETAFQKIDEQIKSGAKPAYEKTPLEKEIEDSARRIRFIENKRDEPHWYDYERNTDEDNMRQLKRLEQLRRELKQKERKNDEERGRH